MVEAHTGDALASYAVAASSFLPPFAKASKKKHFQLFFFFLFALCRLCVSVFNFVSPLLPFLFFFSFFTFLFLSLLFISSLPQLAWD
jgi:hypothetical protein